MDSNHNEDSDDEYETKVWEQKYSGKSGFVFVLDLRKPMCQGGKDSYFIKSFQCCLNAMLQIAREQRYDLVSIVLFGCKVSEGKFAPKGTVLFQPLLTPSIVTIKTIMGVIKDQCEEVINKYGSGQVVSIDEVLNYSKKLLHFCKTKLYTKSIVLFTYDDNPHRNDNKSAYRGRKQAEELKEHGIDLDVVGLGPFDSSLFFKELVLTSRGELMKDWIGQDPVKTIDDVEAEIACLTKKFTRHYGIFYFGQDVQMELTFLKLYHEPHKLIWASNYENEEEKKDEEENADNGNIFEQETQVLDPSTTLEQPSAKKAPEKFPMIGGEYIPMSKKELQRYEIKVPRGLSLIGFKPLSSIPIQTVCGEPYFLLPHSSDKVGEELFSHLLHMCLNKGVAPVCWYSFTKAGNPLLVILYPTEPAEYAKGKIHSHGFHLIKLPFSDMIIDFSDDLPEAGSSETQMDAANGIVKKTTMNWSPDTFSDFEYRSRLAMIEAVAMEYEDVEKVTDETDIDLEAIGQRLGNLSSMFMDCSHLPPEALGKRGADDDKPKTSKPKQPKIEDPGFFISKVKGGEANKLTVAQLRELLRGEGIKSLSNISKPRLVALANERFGL